MRKKILFLVLLTVASNIVFANKNLINSRTSSYYTYIFKISDKEAKEIYKHEDWEFKPSVLHTLVDSILSDSTYKKELPKGHYLKLLANKNKQEIFITSVQDFNIYIINNNTDLNIQVYDLEGKIIEGADVRIKSRKIRYNKKTKTYTIKKSNHRGLLTVRHNGFTAYYNIRRGYNSSFAKRTTRTILYRSPVKYAWLPVKYVIRLPIDGYKSIKSHRTQGVIRGTVKFAERTYHRFLCLFDSYHCDFFDKYKEEGFLVFNKPKYLPGDTVKFKAFVLNKRHRPINKELTVELSGNGNPIKLGEIKPYRKGAYTFKFYLHDSLNLKLDKRYSIELSKDYWNTVISNYFYYEDYELSKIDLKIHTDKGNHYQENKLKLTVSASDENKLNILDARIEARLKLKASKQFYDSSIFIPDTLLLIKKDLLPDEDTEILLSDSTFPSANFVYEIEVKLFTSDYQTKTQTTAVNYFYTEKKLDASIENDSIKIRFLENGVDQKIKASIYAEDAFGNSKKIKEIITPGSIKLDPYIETYRFKAQKQKKEIKLSSESSLVQCYSERNSDSLKVVIDNPRKIPFTYFIYRRNTLTGSGHSDSLDSKTRTFSKQNYFVCLRYLWGGKIIEENYAIALNEKKLNVKVTQPKLIYPGQKTRVDILVTDYDGKPVKNVDLTAYSITDKFKYSVPVLKYLGRSRKNKIIRNNFYLEDALSENKKEVELDYQSWKLLAGIDSIEYYKFIFPENGIYKYTYTPKSNNCTQFAPFVFSNGKHLPAHVIYVDNKPVYFSWSNNTQTYAFNITSGYHQIGLRTKNNLIKIDSVYFEPNKKTILSLDINSRIKDVSIEEAESTLSSAERRALYRYIFPYRYDFGKGLAYLKDDDNIILLKPKQYSSLRIAGPVSGYTAFSLIDRCSTSFIHEPYFEYEFSPKIIKMRSIETKQYPKDLASYTNAIALKDEVFTIDSLERLWESSIKNQRQSVPKYYNPNSTKEEHGRLLLGIEKSPENKIPILNIIIFGNDIKKFVRVYPGNGRLIHQLEEGYYNVVLFYPGSKYQMKDSIFVKKNGLTYQKIRKSKDLKEDKFSIAVNKIIEDKIFSYRPDYGEKEKEINQIYRSYNHQYSYSGDGRFIEGIVTSTEDGLPLPGVTVIVPGTNIGVATDIDGYYSLRVPYKYKTLKFSFIGMDPYERIIGDKTVIDASLTPSANCLDEVVVVGYGTSNKKAFTASMTTVSTSRSSNLTGRIPGLRITNTGVPGSADSIIIRGLGSATTASSKALCIIDGVVYMGDITELDPSLIKNMEVLKGASATALYGSRASNGVIIINTYDGKFTPLGKRPNKGAEFDSDFLQNVSKANSLRNNFSDYAFWKPNLTTDKNGKASFEIIFPDDVTSWKTYYLAINGKKQSGQTQDLIKSYKPLMAQIKTPRFLIQGDSCNAIGKTLSYLPDSTTVQTSFKLNNKNIFSRSQLITNSIIDTLKLKASGDTISVQYQVNRDDGYFDGEKREIPVFPVGMEKTIGNFYVLQKDTTIKLRFDSTINDVHLYAKSNIIKVLEDEINYLINYKYDCNEQLASKLKALLAKEKIAVATNKKFKQHKHTQKLIRQLLDNKTENGLWGWWKNSPESEWISLHVLEALMTANQMGYKAKLDTVFLTQELVWKLENNTRSEEMIRALNILKILDAKVDYKSYIRKIEKKASANLNTELKILKLKQLCNLDYDINAIYKYKKETIFDNEFFADDTERKRTLLNNDIQNTLLAYQILKNDSATNKEILSKIKFYFLEERRPGYWRNTYESALIIEALVSDSSSNEELTKQPTLTISGSHSKTVTDFPFSMELSSSDKISISKKGKALVYLTTYQRFRDQSPNPKGEDFSISTSFKNKANNTLTAGKKIILEVKVNVKKDAEYVMINVPIPAGCSYASKQKTFYFESHREHFKNETAIFCREIKRGEYIFKIELLPRYTGLYKLNPAKIEMMYFPTFNANNGIKKVEIK